MDLSFVEHLKTTYPEEITKDQFYRICHISKKTASFLLETGIVPCRNTGKKTRKYKIYLDDVISFLEKREQNLLVWKTPENYYKKPRKKEPNLLLLEEQKKKIREELAKRTDYYDDVITPQEVATILGYTTKTVNDWCLKNKLRSFLIYNKRKIPKEYLLDFLVSHESFSITQKSELHIEIIKAAFITQQ